MLVALVGCSTPEPAKTVSRRKATATELIDARNSGVIPDWFSPEEVYFVKNLNEYGKDK